MTPLDLQQHLQQHGHALRCLAHDLVRNRDVADDLVQATWAAALDKPPGRPGPVDGWLATVLRRLHLQRRRGELRRTERERSVARSELQPATVDLVTRRETLRAVTTAVFALEEPYQTALLLRYFEGLTPTEIAARTATSVATVKSRLQRGLLLLRGRLDRGLGDRQRWIVALGAATGLHLTTTTTILGTGALLMGSTTKLILTGAAALLLGALAWTMYGTEPPPVPIAPTVVPTAPAAAATAGLDTTRSGDVDRVALPDAEPDDGTLAHPFAFDLEVLVQDRLGLPVEGAKVLIAPAGCRLDAVPERTDANGILHLTWRGRAASMSMVVATRQDETRDAMRQILVASGSPQRVVFGGSNGRGTTLRLYRATAAQGKGDVLSLSFEGMPGKGTVIALDGLVLQQEAFADNPPLRAGLHPFASFADVQWQKRAQTDGPTIEIGELGMNGRLSFKISDAKLDASAAEPLAARIEGIVYGEDGKPCAKCPVAWGTQVDRANQATETDERGAFHFDNVPENALELRAGGGDAGLQHLTVHSTAGQTASVEVHLQRQATVRGRAFAADGKPLAGWRVEWVGVQTQWFDACTVADDGSFVLPNLPGDRGQLLLWRDKGAKTLPVLTMADVLPNSGEVELRYDPEACSGTLQLEPALPDGVDTAAVEARIFQEETGRGAPVRKAKDCNQFSLEGLAAGWYHLELGGPGLGWLDGGRHWVDGKSLVDLGRVPMPRAGSVHLQLPPDAVPGAAGDNGFAVEVYQHRADCDVRIDDPAAIPGGTLPLAPGDYIAIWRLASGARGFEPFTVQVGRVAEVQCLRAQVPAVQADGAAREGR
ncbi:MAG TPA: sigma-70 family RNA polymerase sigma factor [Planctomycetota bacterium]|nr:sigma-70 family RNA polymerase sigma factor [Planctomycetota bacterium]